jgi:hypothetical protein
VFGCGEASLVIRRRRRATIGFAEEAMLKSTLTVALIAIVAMAALIYAMNRIQRVNTWEPAPPDLGPTRIESETRCIDTNAIVGAQRIVLENIKAPATARFSEQRVMYRHGPHVAVRLAVDAQNSFGALIREHYCVFFEYIDCSAGQMNYSREAGFTTCGEWPTAAELATVAKLNGWSE